MLKKLALCALVLAMLAGEERRRPSRELQQIADALDVSTTKTFQVTGNGTIYPPRSEHQPSGGVAEVIREEFDAVIRLHRRSDAR